MLHPISFDSGMSRTILAAATVESSVFLINRFCTGFPQANAFAKSGAKGLYVIVWNEDGSIFDYSAFRQYTPLKGFVGCE